MNPIDKLYYLLREYRKGNYSDSIFCDQFTQVYNIELNYDMLEELEHKLFRELAEHTARFSEYEEDLTIPNVFYSGKDIKSKVEEVFQTLSNVEQYSVKLRDKED